MIDERHDLKQYSDRNQAGRSPWIGASDITRCYRQMAYRYLGVGESNPGDTNAADLGTLLHLGWAAMIGAQHDPADRDTEVVLELDELPRPFTADDVDYKNRVVRDAKTAKDRAWQSWLNNDGPYQSYWDQLHVYGLALSRMYPGEWSLCVVAINRETGEVVEYERPFDEDHALVLVGRARDRHAALMEAVAHAEVTGMDPAALALDFPQEGKGPGRGMPCDWCPWLDTCWPADDDGGSPQSATIRGDDGLIAATAADYLTAAAESRKWEERRKDAQVFLRGLDGKYTGRDGETYTVKMVGGAPKEPVVDCDAAVAALREAGLEVPMRPGGYTAHYPRVNKVRAK